jgi:diamine N-acetyltransferase
MFITGEHIALRAMELSDVDILYTWENRREIWAVSYTQTPFSKEVLTEFVRSIHQDIYATKQLRLMVVELNSGKTIGTIDWFEFDPQHQRVGLGIFIHEDFRRKGYAHEVLELCKNYGFTHLLLKQVYALVAASNESSLQLFEKAGFEKSGLKKAWNRIELNGYEDVWFLQCIKND